jgi:hypothetical protein
LTQSNQKSSHPPDGGFLAAQAFAHNRPKPGLESFCPTSFAQAAASAKISYALQPHKASIVLADFGRSSSADGKSFVELAAFCGYT